MADNSHGTPVFDPNDLNRSQKFWTSFMRYTMIGIGVIVVVLALMAIFLV